MTWKRFDDGARRMVVVAQEQARGFKHNYIGTEHLLLGILGDPEGLGAQALRGLGVDRDEVWFAVLEVIGEGQQEPQGHIPFTKRAKKVLELSLRESEAWNDHDIRTEHVLLALFAEGEGVGVDVLRKQGISGDQVRSRIKTLRDAA